jgi:hypothetical protein
MLLALIALTGPALPLAAQPVLVVPPGSEVVIPPRGAAIVARPRPVLPPVATPRIEVATPGPIAPASDLSGGTLGSAAPALLALPLAALGVLATSNLPGGGSGTTAPARTR